MASNSVLNELAENPDYHDFLDDTLCSIEAKLSQAKFAAKIAQPPKPIQSQPTLRQPSNLAPQKPANSMTETTKVPPAITDEDDFELDDLDPLASKPKQKTAAPIDDIMDIEFDEQTDFQQTPPQPVQPDSPASPKQSPSKADQPAPKSLSSILSRSKKLKPKPSANS